MKWTLHLHAGCVGKCKDASQHIFNSLWEFVSSALSRCREELFTLEFCFVIPTIFFCCCCVSLFKCSKLKLGQIGVSQSDGEQTAVEIVVPLMQNREKKELNSHTIFGFISKQHVVQCTNAFSDEVRIFRRVHFDEGYCSKVQCYNIVFSLLYILFYQ